MSTLAVKNPIATKTFFAPLDKIIFESLTTTFSSDFSIIGMIYLADKILQHYIRWPVDVWLILETGPRLLISFLIPLCLSTPCLMVLTLKGRSVIWVASNCSSKTVYSEYSGPELLSSRSLPYPPRLWFAGTNRLKSLIGQDFLRNFRYCFQLSSPETMPSRFVYKQRRWSCYT